MALQEQSVAEQLFAARERYVARGAGNPKLVVAGAHGAVIESSRRARVPRLRGRHRLPEPRPRAREGRRRGARAGRPLPAPDVDGRLLRALRRGLPPARRDLPVRRAPSKSMLINSGAEAVENAVKISRAATGRPAVLVFDRAFHGRTLLAMTMTSKLVYKKTFGPFAPEIYRVPAPYEYRGISSDDAIAAHRAGLQDRGRSRVRGLRRARARAGRGRLHPDAARLPGAPQGAARPLRHPLRGRRDPVRLRPHRDDVGDRALRRAARPRHLRQDARRRPAAGGRDRSRRGHGRAAHRRASAARSPATPCPAPPRPSCWRSWRARTCSAAATRLGERLRGRARRRAEPDHRDRRRARPRADARDRARHRPQDQGAGGRPRLPHDRRGARARPAADGLGRVLATASASCRRSTSRTRSWSAASTILEESLVAAGATR